MNTVNAQLNVFVIGYTILTGSEVIELNFDSPVKHRNTTLKKMPSLCTHRNVNPLLNYFLTITFPTCRTLFISLYAARNEHAQKTTSGILMCLKYYKEVLLFDL
jgi:hypothetical protein